MAGAPGLLESVEQLLRVVTSTRFPLAIPGAPAARKARVALINQAEDYLLPRLQRADAPLLAVVGGSTGSGKSTLVNSLAGKRLSPASVLRPTTRSPVLVSHPADVKWFSDDRILPRLRRTNDPSAQDRGSEVSKLAVVTAAALTPGIALLDAPDLDSIVDANRDLATELLAAADLWVFVTTSSRYADAVPWDALRTAETRGTSVAIVLDRLPKGAEEIAQHLRQMLRKEGLGTAPLLVVPQTPLQDGLLPGEIINPVRQWLASLANDGDQRLAIANKTLDGAIGSLRPRTTALVRHASAQDAAAADLREDVQGTYLRELEQVSYTIDGGDILHGEVLARWQEFVSSGELARTIRARDGKARNQLAAAFASRSVPGEALSRAIAGALAAAVEQAAEQGAEASALRWKSRDAGAAMLAEHPDLARASTGFGATARRAVEDWQAAVIELARPTVPSTTPAKNVEAAATAAGLAVMTAAVLPVGQLVDGLPAPSRRAGSGDAEALVSSVRRTFEGHDTRRMARRAKGMLLESVRDLLEGERRRFEARLTDAGVGERTNERLREAAGAVEAARLAAGGRDRPRPSRAASREHWSQRHSAGPPSPRPVRTRT
ncbi:dynamin family protein [Fodinicola acaciae]|uniref:dynamin family protein n=1 Tax=Fodinicola acaciae TaxID=2681555 RepID=UPI0013D5AC41|nr:dynamin family protein [Fodinicola acaciae]